MNVRQALKDFSEFLYDVETSVTAGDAVLILNALADYIESDLNDTGESHIPMLGSFRLDKVTQKVTFEPQDMTFYID